MKTNRTMSFIKNNVKADITDFINNLINYDMCEYKFLMENFICYEDILLDFSYRLVDNVWFDRDNNSTNYIREEAKFLVEDNNIDITNYCANGMQYLIASEYLAKELKEWGGSVYFLCNNMVWCRVTVDELKKDHVLLDIENDND